jgi:hypothetical protein
MARVTIGVTVASAANPAHPTVHTAAPATSGGETNNVYLSYDAAVVTSYAQLVSGVNAALLAVKQGPLKANS